MRTRDILRALLIVVGASCAFARAAEPTPIEVKVVVVTMFEIGA